MAITYNAGTNTSTVTGYTEAVPCTFLDIFNADVAGGWGVVTRQCTNQYCFDARIQVGDGSIVTWFADENQLVVYTDAAITAHNQVFIMGRTNSHTRLGKCLSATDKSTSKGCMIIGQEPTLINGSVGGNVSTNEYMPNLELYGCLLRCEGTGQNIYITDTSKVYDCIFTNQFLYKFKADFNNVVFSDNPAYAAIQYPQGIYNKLSVFNCNRVVYIGGAATENITMKNLYARGNTKIGRLINTSYDLILLNGDSDTWSAVFSGYTGKLYRKYEFDLKVQDKDENAINGAAVKIWDLNNNLVVDTTTNASGVISTQTLNYGYYNQAGGDTPVMQTPHIIQISKAGYETYQKKWTLDDKTDWTIALHIPKRRFDSIEG